MNTGSVSIGEFELNHQRRYHQPGIIFDRIIDGNRKVERDFFFGYDVKT